MRKTVLFILCMVSMSFSPQNNGWITLLDKDLKNWDTFLSYEHSRLGPPGTQLYPDEKPIGYNNDKYHVFTVIEENGEPILKISGEKHGGIFTKKEYKNYHFKTMVKWGTKKYEHRINMAMDSGILYHSIGECGWNGYSAWMLAQEMQVCEGEFGRYYGQWETKYDVKLKNDRYDPKGTWTNVEGAKEYANYEKPKGEWNTLELICYEGNSLHIVNGHVVMALKNSTYLVGNEQKPLVKGKILLQSEAAEVYYKGIQIKELKSLPKQYAHYFN